MGAVLDVMMPEIEKTIKKLDTKRFESPRPNCWATFLENNQRHEFGLQETWFHS